MDAASFIYSISFADLILLIGSIMGRKSMDSVFSSNNQSNYADTPGIVKILPTPEINSLIQESRFSNESAWLTGHD